MKKGLAFVLLTALVAGCFLGCSGGQQTEAPTEAPTTAAPTAAPTTAAPIDTAAEFSKGLTDGGLIENFNALSSVKVPDWNSVEVPKSELEPDAAQVDGALQTILNRFPVRITDRPVENGDLVNLDYEGKLNGVAFEGGTDKGADLEAGSERFVDNFLTKIIGHRPGETFDIEITFPDPYENNADLSGKLTVFTVTINYISGQAELTDEFVETNAEGIKNFTGFEVKTAEELRKAVHDYFYDTGLREKIYVILGEIKVETIPEVVYEYVYHATDLSIRASYGYSLEDAASMSGMTEEELRAQIEKDCYAEIFFQAIAEAEGWDIRESDFGEVTGRADNEEYISYYGKGYIARAVLIDRAIQYLREHLKFVD